MMEEKKKLKKNQKKSPINDNLERELFNLGYEYVIGVDEVGRGCWAGPVVVAAYVHSQASEIYPYVNDSKKVTPLRRKKLNIDLCEGIYALGEVDHVEIDEINILNATRLAINRALGAIENLFVQKTMVLIDGYFKDPFEFEHRFIKAGDAKHYSIAAASIIAKEHRDSLMRSYSTKYPEYGFDKHVGYGTAQHREAIQRCGICDIHRRSYKPIKSIIYKQ